MSNIHTTDDKRKKFIKAIKTKQRQLGLDDATYRAMLLARTGKTSTTQCGLTELGLVSDYLTHQGAINPKAPVRAPRRTNLAADRQNLRQKVDSLMLELSQVTTITDPAKYQSAICARNGWCTDVAFADAHILHKLVGTLAHTLASKTRAVNASATKG